MKSKHGTLRFALRELVRNKAFSILFIINLSFGLSGIAFVEQFKGVFADLMQERSLSILGADIALTSRFAFNDELIGTVLAEFPQGTRFAKTSTMMSMARGNPSVAESSRLVTLSKIGSGYPFYGEIKLQEMGNVPSGNYQAPRDDSVWVYPELLSQLGAKVGEKIAIGASEYFISDIVLEDPGQTMRMGGIAPKVFISEGGLERAKLLGEGSTARYQVAFKFPKQSEVDVNLIAQKLETLFPSTDMRVVTPTKASEGLARGLDYLGDFLGLVSVVALFLASVGLFYLYRSYLSSKRREIAILNFLGLAQKEILKIFSLHLCLLGALGTMVSLLFISILFPPIISYVNDLLPFTLSSALATRAVIATLCVGLGGTILLCLPLVSPLVKTRALHLLQDRMGAKSVLSFKSALWFLPWFLFCSGLSIWMAAGLKVGSLFIGVIAFVAIVLFPLGMLILMILNKWGRGVKSLPFKLAIGYLCRFRFASLSLFFALSLSVLLLHLIPQLEHNLKDEFLAPTDQALPSLFLFDIQEEQLGPLREVALKHDASFRLISPMIRSRILSLNGVEYKRDDKDVLTREEQEERRIRNRGLNISYRAQLDSSESIIKGTAFTGRYDGESEFVEVSLEERWASRMELDVGDTLSFDVFGLPIKGKVVSLRHVRWTSFVPNFFVMVQPGVLEDAPKTYVAALSQMDSKNKASFESELFTKLSNISSIDVSRIIERMLGLLSQMAMALKIMSILSLIVGLLVLYSLINHQMRERARDLVLLKVLGANSRMIRRSVRIQLLLICGSSTFFGLLLSSVVVWFLSRMLFDGLRSFDYWLTLFVGLSAVALSLIVGEVSARKWLRLRAREALNDA